MCCDPLCNTKNNLEIFCASAPVWIHKYNRWKLLLLVSLAIHFLPWNTYFIVAIMCLIVMILRAVDAGIHVNMFICVWIPLRHICIQNVSFKTHYTAISIWTPLSTFFCVLLFWGCFSWLGLGSFVPMKGNINATPYNYILDNGEL